MIVDDNPDDIHLLENLLESEYEITSARNSEEMWQLIDMASPVVLLLEVMMPGKDGYRVANELHATIRYRNLNIIFLSEKGEASDVVEGFQRGGFDYIRKPFNGQELLARLKLAVKTAHERERLETSAFTDPLTGLYNRRYLTEYISGETERALRKKTTFAIAIIDLDKFKLINDERGLQCGDYLLREFAALIKGSLREYDLAVRYGGEEFIIVFPSETKQDAVGVLERIRDNLAAAKLEWEGAPVVFTFTAGAAGFEEIETAEYPLEDLIRKADRRLYKGKQSGRNMIVAEGA